MFKKATLLVVLTVLSLNVLAVLAGPTPVVPIAPPAHQSLYTMFGGTASVKLNVDGSVTRIGEATVALQGSGHLIVRWSDNAVVNGEEVDDNFATVIPHSFGRLLIQNDQNSTLSVQDDASAGNMVWWFDGRANNPDGTPNAFERTGTTTIDLQCVYRTSTNPSG